MRALANQQIVEDATKANGFGLEEFRAAQLSVLDEIATALLAEARRRGIEGAQARLAATRGVGEVASPSLGASRMRSLERALRARTEQAAATGPVREPPARASPQRGTPKATSPAKGGALQADVKAKRKEKTMAETNGSEGRGQGLLVPHGSARLLRKPLRARLPSQVRWPGARCGDAAARHHHPGQAGQLRRELLPDLCQRILRQGMGRRPVQLLGRHPEGQQER